MLCGTSTTDLWDQGFNLERSGGFGVYLCSGIWDKGRFTVKLAPATPTAVTRAHVHADGKVPGKMFAAEAMMVWLHIAHYVQCRDSWTHLEDSPETRPGKSPKTKPIPLPATLSSGRLRRDVEAELQPGIILFSWPVLHNVATFSTRVELVPTMLKLTSFGGKKRDSLHGRDGTKGCRGTACVLLV